jgi:hypothetical protein
MPGLQVLDRLDAFAEGCGLELGARVAARLFEFLEDVAYGRQAEALVDVLARRQRLEQSATSPISSPMPLRMSARMRSTSGIGFRVHRRRVERVVAPPLMRRKPAASSKVFSPRRGTSLSAWRLRKAPCLVAVGDDVRRQRRAEAGDASEQRHRGGVDVDSDGVHAVLDHRGERLGQPGLADVMLVLADADRLRIDLHQFGQRVLQAPGDRHRAAQADVEFRELARGVLGGRIDRSAGFGDDDLAQVQFGLQPDQVGNQTIGLARGGAVADADQIDAMLARELGQVCSEPSQSRRGSCG